MYYYDLVNNHYIVHIDDKKYLIDTGYPYSFCFKREDHELVINCEKYDLREAPSDIDYRASIECIGTEVVGFIGMDIISKTSLTIYKDGILDFVNKSVDGHQVMINGPWPLSINVGINGMTGKFIIDTGAKYGYGVKGLFLNKKPYDHVDDYNPSLGYLNSDIYSLEIILHGLARGLSVCDNSKVASLLKRYNAIAIGTISSLFNEVCVIDMERKVLVLN